MKYNPSDSPMSCVRADDVTVRDAPGKTDFAAKTVQSGRILVHDLWAQRLDRHGFAELLVDRLVDHTHAAGPEDALDLVPVGERRSGFQGCDLSTAARRRRPVHAHALGLSLDRAPARWPLEKIDE